MKLRTKFLIALGIALLVLVGTLLALNLAVVRGGFRRVEELDARQNVERARDGVAKEIDLLRLRSADWGAWDDSYQFVVDLNAEFQKVNLTPQTIADLRVNALAWVNAEGKIVCSRGSDFDSGAEADVPASFLALLAPGNPLVTHPDLEHSLGCLVLLPEGPAIVSSRPIITTRHEGPSHGSLIWMRWLNPRRVEELSRETHLDIRLERLDRPLPDASWSEAAAWLSTRPGEAFLRDRDGDTIDGFGTIQDLSGHPALLLRVALPRTIHRQAMASDLYLFISVLVVGGLLALGIAFLVERLVLAPVLRMRADVERITASREFAGRLDAGGRDELASLAQRINEMLAEVVRANEQVLAAARVKSQFLANVSHEIRTPLNGILGLTSLALDGSVPPGLRSDLEAIRASGRTLLELINDVLDLSRIESGKIEVERVAFSLHRHLDEASLPLRALTRQKGILLSVEIGPGVPDGVVGDPLRLRQVLTNLVGNAIKFTEKGGVTVRVELEPRGGPEARVRFEVRDTGIGISPEHHQRIFEAFTQADGSTTRRFGGTGLGLAISNHLVELMGGRITLTSELGRGSVFSFSLHLPTSASPALAQPVAPAGPVLAARGLRILVAEDNIVNQVVASRTLLKMGHRPVIVDTGARVLGRMAAESFDIVLMDVQMPDMDGLEATRRLRKMEEGGKIRTPVIALTAHAMRGDEERCLAAGMDGYVSKPLDAAELARAIDKVAPEESKALVHPAAPEPESSSFDHKRLIQRVGGDKSILAEVIRVFLREAPVMVEDIRKAAASGDERRLRDAAHKIKGALLQLDADASARHAEVLERGGSSAASLAGLEIEVAALLVALEKAERDNFPA